MTKLDQSLQPAFPGDLGACPALGLVGQVDVFQHRLAVGLQNLEPQLIGHLALRIDRIEDRVAPTFHFAQVNQAFAEIAELRVVKAVGDFLAIAGDERDGRAFVDQSYRGRHLCRPRIDLGGDGGGKAVHIGWHGRRSVWLVSAV